VINPYEIQNRLFDASSGLADKIGRDIGSYTVALLSVTGSGEEEVLRFLRFRVTGVDWGLDVYPHCRSRLGDV
jgi:hypothetical protein